MKGLTSRGRRRRASSRRPCPCMWARTPSRSLRPPASSLPLIIGELPCAPSKQSTLISWNAQPNRAKCCCGNQKLARQRGVVLTDVEMGEELVLERAPRTRS